MSEIITIRFIFNQSHLYYYLLLFFYFDHFGRIEFHFLLSFIIIFHFYDSNYDIISEIQIIIIILVRNITPIVYLTLRFT